MNRPATGAAAERTRLAVDRTVLSASVLAAALLRIGLEHRRWLDVAAGVTVAVTALLVVLGARWRHPRRLAAIGWTVALAAALLAAQALL